LAKLGEEPWKASNKHEVKEGNTPRAKSTGTGLDTKKMEQNSKVRKSTANKAPKAKKKQQTKKKNILDFGKGSVKETEDALAFLKRRKITLSDFVSQVKNAKALESKYGKSYEAILEDYETKMEQVAKATASLVELEDLKENVETRISRLKDLEALQSLLDENGVAPDGTSEYIRQYKRLGQFGFDVNTVRLIAEELKRLQLDPKEADKLIANWLTKYRSVNEALARAEAQVEEAKNEEALTIARIRSLEKKAEEAQKKIESLENYYTRRSESLEAEYKNRERVLDSRYIEERSRAEAELFEILRERDKMRTENRTLRDELEAIRRDIDLAKSLSTIIRDPNSLSSSQLDILISEFMKAKEVREKERIVVSPSPSSERLLQARQMLVSALRDLSSLENN
jgi:hypothetical protein